MIIITSGTKSANVQATKKLLEEKEKTIQVLKKILKVLGMQHVQLSELTVLQQEKDKIYQELMDFKGKMLKLHKDKEAYEIEGSGFLSQISTFNANRKEEEEVLEELMSQPLIQTEDEVNKSPAEDLYVSMS